METNKSKHLSRKDFIKAFGVFAGSAVLAACTPEISEAIPTETYTVETTNTLEPTKNASPTETLKPITIEDRFKLGSYNAAKDPFEIVADEELRRLLDHHFDLEVTYTGKVIIPSTTGPAMPDRTRYEDFENARKDNSEGNPVMAIPADLLNKPDAVTKHIILSTHSRQADVPGELSREIFVWLNKNPDRASELYSQSIPFKVDGKSFEAQIVNVAYISETYWEGLDQTTPWREFPQEKVVFAKSELLGMPKEITENLGEDEYLVTIVGCLPVEPFVKVETDKKIDENLAYYLNGFNRALVTYKLTIKP